MPRAKVEKVLSVENGMEVVEVEVAAGGGEKDAKKILQYKRPTAAVIDSFVNGLMNDSPALDTFTSLFGTGEDAPKAGKEETNRALLHRIVNNSLDKMLRAAAYESIAAESTEISIGKEKVDVLGFPLRKLVQGINGMLANVNLRASTGGDTEEARKSAEKSVGFGPWKTAARKLVEAKAVTWNEDEGVYKLVDGVSPTAKATEVIG